MGITSTKWIDKGAVLEEICKGAYPVKLNYDGLVLTTLTKNDFDQTAIFIGENFINRGPVARFLKAPRELWESRARETFELGLGTSFIIKDAAGRVYGSTIAYRYDEFLIKNEELPEFACESLKAERELFLASQKAYVEFLRVNNYETQDIIIMSQGNVDASLRGKGMGFYLMIATFLAAKEHRFKRAITLCSSMFSERLVQSLPGAGVQILNRIEYDTFTTRTNDGRTVTPFKGLNEEFTRYVNDNSKGRTFKDAAKYFALAATDIEQAAGAALTYIRKMNSGFSFCCNRKGFS